MKNTRRGLGKGKGIGYYNLVPIDSHIHSLSAKGVKTDVVRFGAYQYKVTSPHSLGFRSNNYGVFAGISLSPEALLNRMYKQRHNLKAELGRAYQNEASEFELLRIRDELEQLENNIKIVQKKLGKRLDAKGEVRKSYCCACHKNTESVRFSTGGIDCKVCGYAKKEDEV